MNILKENNDGYTLVETVVALAILIAVIIPISQFMVRIIYTERTRDTIITAQLARQEIERNIANNHFKSYQCMELLNNKEWRIVQSVREINNLVYIDVQVFKNNETKPLAELKTIRLNYD